MATALDRRGPDDRRASLLAATKAGRERGEAPLPAHRAGGRAPVRWPRTEDGAGRVTRSRSPHGRRSPSSSRSRCWCSSSRRSVRWPRPSAAARSWRPCWRSPPTRTRSSGSSPPRGEARPAGWRCTAWRRRSAPGTPRPRSVALAAQAAPGRAGRRAGRAGVPGAGRGRRRRSRRWSRCTSPTPTSPRASTPPGAPSPRWRSAWWSARRWSATGSPPGWCARPGAWPPPPPRSATATWTCGSPAGPRELAEAGAAFNQMADRWPRMRVAEREMVADLSHRLRTPLTGLRLDVEALDASDPSTRVEDADRHRTVGASGRRSATLEREIDVLIRTTRAAGRAATRPAPRPQLRRQRGGGRADGVLVGGRRRPEPPVRGHRRRPRPRCRYPPPNSPPRWTPCWATSSATRRRAPRLRSRSPDTMAGWRCGWTTPAAASPTRTGRCAAAPATGAPPGSGLDIVRRVARAGGGARRHRPGRAGRRQRGDAVRRRRTAAAATEPVRPDRPAGLGSRGAGTRAVGPAGAAGVTGGIRRVAARLLRRRMARTLSACGPFGPWVISNPTRWFSSGSGIRCASMAEKWTNTSAPPPSTR